MTEKWSLLVALVMVLIEMDNTKYVLIETEDRYKGFSLLSYSLCFIIYRESSQDTCVDYKGNHYQIGESFSDSYGCSGCICRGVEGSAEPECPGTE